MTLEASETANLIVRVTATQSNHSYKDNAFILVDLPGSTQCRMNICILNWGLSSNIISVFDDEPVLCIRMFHQTTICRRDNYTSKNFVPPINKIPCGESSQIDGLKAGKITFKDYHLIWWAKVVFTNFLTTNKLGYS